MKKSLRVSISLFLVFVITLIPIFTSFAATIVEPNLPKHVLTYQAGPVDNPLKGFMPFSDPSEEGYFIEPPGWDISTYDNFPHSMRWFYIPLSSIQTGYNSFDWSALEAKINSVSSVGYQACFRVYLDYPKKAVGTPQFLINDGVPMRTYTNYENTTSKSPDYDDPKVLLALQNFIAAFGAKYDGDPRIGFITMGLVGFWGEWHTYPQVSYMPTLANQNQIILWYDNAFNKTKILLRSPRGESNIRNIGYHDDSFAFQTLTAALDPAYGQSWMFWGNMLAAGTQNTWKTQPTGGEMRPEIQQAMFDNDPPKYTGPLIDNQKGQDYNVCVDTTHASWLMAQYPFEFPYPEPQKTRALNASRRLGYEYHVPNTYFNDTITSASTPLDVGVTIENRGVAPFYYNWNVQVGVRNSSGAITTYDTGWDISGSQLLPGSPQLYRYTKNTPNLANGSYDLLLRVVNPLSNGKKFRFANIEQNDDGWLKMGSFTVAIGSVVPTNTAPQVSAGADQVITLPNTASLSGTVTDDGLPAGGTLTQTWTKVSGPGMVTFANANATSTTATFSVAGTYVVRLTASDTALTGSDDATVNVTSSVVNLAPVVNAGSDKTITLPTNSVAIDATVTDDNLPTGATVTYAWTKLSGPGTVTFASPSAVDTSATFSVEGTYVLRLTASDTALSGTDDVTVTVNSGGEPGVNGLSGAYFNNKTLTGTATVTRVDPTVNFSWGTGSPTAGIGTDNFSVRWTGFVKAPVTGTYTFYVNSNDGNKLWVNGTQLTNRWSDGVSEQSGTITLTAGQSYPITLEAYESANSASCVLSWTYTGQTKQVIPTASLYVGGSVQNMAPVVNAGSDKTITLPTNSVAIDATVTDDGLPTGATVTYAWTKVSGPGTVTFANPSAVDTTATFSAEGAYVLRLTANDTALTGSDDVTVTVNGSAVNIAPVVNAGSDKTITLPTNSVAIDATVTDDGLPTGATVTYEWTKVSGPGTVTFANSNVVDTTVTFSMEGTYVLQLAASDTALAATDTVTVTVNPVASGVVNGLTGAYFGNKTLTGTATVTRVDPTVNFSWGTGSPATGIGTDNFSVRWTGFVVAPVTGTYTFYVNSNDGNKLWVNGTQLTNRWSDGASEQSGTITLTAGQSYAIILESYESANSASCVLSWTYTGQTKQVIPTASLISK